MPAVAGAALLGGLTLTAYPVIGFGTFYALEFSMANALLGAASSLILGGISRALAPSPPKGKRPVSEGITRQVRQPITSRKLIYGTARSSGPIVYMTSTSNNRYLHMVIPVADHQVQEIGELLLNDESITDDMLDGSGNVTSGTYSGYVRIKKHLGTTSQTADADLIAEVAELDSNFRLQGVAYIYIRLEHDREIFAAGVPNISAWVRGKLLTDPRTAQSWDVTNAVYDNVSYSILAENANVGGLVLSSNGDYVFTVNAASATVYRYPLTSPWDVSTMGATDQSLDLTGQATVATEFQFNDDGTKLYALDRGTDFVYQYNLTTAYDLTTATYASKSVDISTEEGSAWGMFFKTDGTKMYISGETSDLVYQYTLSTAWDVSTATYDSATGSVASEDNLPRSIFIKSDGTTLYMAGHTNDVVYQYTMSTPWDITTLSYASKSFDISSQETSPQGIWFKDDGSKMYIVGQSSDSVLQYSLDSTQSLYTPNPALMVYDYLRNARYGYEAATDEIDVTYINAAANDCEDMVDVTNTDFTISSADATTDIITLGGTTLGVQDGDKVRVSGASLPGGLTTGTDYYVEVYQRQGTPRIKLCTTLADAWNQTGTNVNITSSGTGTLRKIAEPRYQGGGVIDTSEDLKSNTERILSAMAGRAVYGGGWRIYAGTYTTPTVTLDESHIVSPITMQPTVSRQERFNTVKGEYASPINSGLPADYPSVTNSTYVTEDQGVEIIKDHDQPLTQRAHQAMRVAKIELEKVRQQISFSADFNLAALQCQAGETVMITNTRFGWSSKPFEITKWEFASRPNDDGIPTPVVHMELRETGSSVYDWNSGEETAVDPEPNTNLPNAFTVEVVTGFSLDSVLVSTQGGDYVFKVDASWDVHPNYFVQQGGWYEVLFKETTEGTYRSAGTVDGTVTIMTIPQLKPDVLYDIEIIAYNHVGSASTPTVINNFQVGTTVTTNTEDWENLTETRNPDDWETDTEASEDWE